MKKYFLIAAVLFAANSFAQKKDVVPIDRENFFRFGVKGGVNINKITGQSYSDGFNFNYQAGVFFQFNFSQRFGLQPEISLVQSSTTFNNDPSGPYYDLFLGGSQKNATFNYLEIPVLLNINVGQSKHVKLQVGPSYGGLLSKTIDNLKNGNTDSLKYSNADWSAIGGLWIQLPLVNFGARYKYGLNDINNSAVKTEAWHNQSIQVFVGVTF
ncbi:porin family protein [Ferruginibacter albus]|uniref:porin family protein n=1 Tax=Ferruginibacter albus TaxID=2875540 RepID=UPI001CC813AB|nr:porin family protein [Ferruginibacter albus]UAY52608.1 PorT family protein [Ferruginibacter albus]